MGEVFMGVYLTVILAGFGLLADAEGRECPFILLDLECGLFAGLAILSAVETFR